MAAVPEDRTQGVLDWNQALRTFSLDRRPPAPALAAWIEHYWEVVWNLPPGEAHRQTNLSHAAFNVAVEDDGVWTYGVPGPTFVREIAGRGRVFGVKFWPGAFHAWHGKGLSKLYDRREPAVGILGTWVDAWAAGVSARPGFADRCAWTDEVWAARPAAAPGAGTGCARRLMQDRTLVRVEEAASVLGYTARGLQRLFDREVGVPPKEVLRRYRLMEAAERLVKEPDLPGGELAASLGYADQAHFIRDFKAVTGLPPEAYRRRQR